MNVTDFHTHAFPDSLADRAIASLEAGAEGSGFRAFHDGRVSGLLASMDAAGIDRSVICPIATKPEQFDGILAWCRSIGSERIVPFGSLHPKSPRAIEQVAAIGAAGLAGIKLHPMYQEFAIDAPELDPLYAAIAERGLLLVQHCGDDVAYPGSDLATPQRIAAMMGRHPTLRLVATHLGGWNVWDEVRQHVLGLPGEVYLETSFAPTMLPPDEAVAMIRTHGADRVLFGTDSPWNAQDAELAALRALPLTSGERVAIEAGNAARLLDGRA